MSLCNTYSELLQTEQIDMPIKLANNLELPNNAVTQTFAFIGTKGTGKTYAAGKLIEGLLLIDAPVTIIDPVGNWWGLRLDRAGKKPCFDIPVFGGANGDVELYDWQGERLGELISEHALSAVIDISRLRKGARKNFVAEFCESLFFHAKEKKRARMVVFEEAQVFAPQRTQPGEERMLGAVEDIVRLGRNYGLGSLMITQRPQSVSKEVLNMVECLVVGQMIAAHERKAINDWVLEHKAEKDWIEQLPSLPQGEMMVWSPRWLDVMQRVKVLKKISFDASATPELGDIQFAPKALKVDIDWLKSELATAPAKVLKGKPVPVVPPDAELIKRIETLEADLGNLRAHHAALAEAIGAMLYSVHKVLNAARDELNEMQSGFTTAAEQFAKRPGVLTPTATPVIEPKHFFLNERQEVHVPKAEKNTGQEKPTKRKLLKRYPPSSELQRAMENVEIKAGAVRMLKALAGFYPNGTMTRAQIGKVAKVKSSSGTFGQYWGALNRAGYIEAVGVGLYRATKLGVEFLGTDYEEIGNDYESRYNFWAPRLKKGERAMLDHVLKSKAAVSRAGIADATNYAESSGTFGQYLGTLVRNKLITKQGNLFVPHPWLLGHE